MFSVLTLNLRFGLADDGPNSWQYRKQSLPVLLAKYRADFIGFQEANDFQIDYLNSILTEYNLIGQRRPAPSFWQNNIIYYKNIWSCIYQEHFFLSPTPTVPSRFRHSLWPRQCTVGIFKKNQHQLMCVNTHFDFEASVQNQSARLILKRLSYLPSGLPAILMGDFNASPASRCHQIFVAENQNSADKDQGFRNAFQAPFIGTRHEFDGDASGDHIDWILFRGKITLKDSQVIQNTIGGIYPSDHFPLWASFEWEKK